MRPEDERQDTSPLYLYGIAQGRIPSPFPILGIGERSLEVIRFWDLAALVSAAPPESLLSAASTALRHQRVLEAALQVADVLPVRYGTLLSSAESVRELLTERCCEFQDRLSRVQGCVEYGVRFLLAGDGLGEPLRDGGGALSAGGSGARGADYLKRKLEAFRREERVRTWGEEWVERIHRRLSPLAREAWVKTQAGRRLLVSACYLVERSKAGVFEAALGALPAAFPEVPFLPSGPWPPYSFATARDGEASSGGPGGALAGLLFDGVVRECLVPA